MIIHANEEEKRHMNNWKTWIIQVGFEILRTMDIFWYIIPRSPLNINRCSEGT
jgi:hypothetical protein